MDKERFIVGVDIGGSHVTACLVDAVNKNVLKENIVRNKVDSHASAEDILKVWEETIKEVAGSVENGFPKVGFAMPGPFNYEEGICLIKGFNKYEALYNLNIREILACRLDTLGKNILFRNDAEAFLDGEIFCGAAVGYKDVIGITLGTGLGSAYSHDGVTVDAELSVTPYDNGIIEESVSTRGLLAHYFQLTGEQLPHAKELADRYTVDENARRVFARFADDLAWFLGFFIDREKPEMLVVGGNIAQAWEFFMPQVINKLSSSLLRLPEIRMAKLGEDAAMIGGACCFLHPLFMNRI